MAKRAIALLIGNNNYPGNELSCAVNDATDLGNALSKLGFEVKTLTDVSYSAFDSAVSQFEKDVQDYDISLFFYAGHGFQVKGENFLTAIDTNATSETQAKHSSIKLDLILEVMETKEDNTNIVILDACRNNPFGRKLRGTPDGLAPVFAPKGTIIAYATSPGQVALEGDKNGLYTGALLQHIQDVNIPIEELFKRVRNTVSNASDGEQISWEHTSLTGNFFFNAGQIIAAISGIYTQNVIADGQYVNPNQTPAQRIIAQFKSHNYYQQNDGVGLLHSLQIEKEDKNDLFILGRNLLQSSMGGSFAAKDYITYINKHIDFFQNGESNHVLNGLLFEMYFDSNGDFRANKFKCPNPDSILGLLKDKKFSSSKDFIMSILAPYRDLIFRFPDSDESIVFDINTEKRRDKWRELKAINFEGRNIYFPLKSEYMGSNSITYQSLKEKIACELAIPQSKIVFTSNENLKDENYMAFLVDYELKKL